MQKRRIGEIRAFYVHPVVYTIINIYLFILNAVTGPGVLWLYRAAFFRGVGPAIHGLDTYAGSWLFGKEWEERKIGGDLVPAHPVG